MNLTAAALRAIAKKKRAGSENSREEIEALVRGFCAGDIDDAQLTLWLKAVMAAGMSIDETAWLTDAMASSGVMLDWRDVPGIVVDKHSTGGVGDDVSLIAVPLAAACGVKVAKLSGRALGHTGGTLDKLECVPGLQTNLSTHAFTRQVAEVGCAIAQASEQLAPADKKMYVLRDRTKTIASVPLITASVLSKKIAGGAPHLVIDVKAGRCAFMQTVAQARRLAEMILLVGARLGRRITVLITDMESPLANSVGDALELDEALGVLAGGEEGRLHEVALEVAEAMLAVHHADDPQLRPRLLAALQHSLRDGSASARFAAMASAQGGNLRAFERSFQADQTVVANAGGFLTSIDGRVIGEAVAEQKVAAGRTEGSRIGVRLRKREGEQVKKGDALLDVFGGKRAGRLAERLRGVERIAAEPPPRRPAVIDRMHAEPQPTM